MIRLRDNLHDIAESLCFHSIFIVLEQLLSLGTGHVSSLSITAIEMYGKGHWAVLKFIPDVAQCAIIDFHTCFLLW